jgi:flagellar hook assembly protein FlgD
VKIFNALGQDVCTLVNTYQPAGEWSITWDGTNNSQQAMNPGIYFYQLKAGSSVTTHRMVLLAD